MDCYTNCAGAQRNQLAINFNKMPDTNKKIFFVTTSIPRSCQRCECDRTSVRDESKLKESNANNLMAHWMLGKSMSELRSLNYIGYIKHGESIEVVTAIENKTLSHKYCYNTCIN